MNIGIDYRAALRPHGTGVSRYVRDLVPALAGLDGCLQLTLFHDEGRGATVPIGPRLRHLSSRPVFRRNGLRQVWEEVWLPAAIARRCIDVYHGPHAFLPYILPSPVAAAVTVHDVIHRAVPDSVSRFFRTRLDAGLRHSIKRADIVVADSMNTARDLAVYYRVPDNLITVIYPGVASSFPPSSEEDARQYVAGNLGMHAPFILYVGGLGARKNVLTLLEAFATLRNVIPGDLHLVLVGAKSGTTELVQFVERNRMQEVVHFPGYIADVELPMLYSAATVFAYPSLYEGFGYPVVEAMACGAPVVCSNSSSLPEVVGTAGHIVSATDIGAWVQALRSVVLAPDDGRPLRSASLQQAARFSLENEARLTHDAYAEAKRRARTRSGIADGHAHLNRKMR